MTSRPITLIVAMAAALLAGCAEAMADVQYQLTFSTYLGGNDIETSRDVCTDAQGNIYVVGGTRSTNFPIIGGTAFNPGPLNDSRADQLMDAFVAKFSPAGQLLWSTCLGGPNYDRAYAVEVDNSGNVYVAGRAGKDFPVTAGAFQTTFNGSDMTDPPASHSYGGWQNGFVAKFSPSGTKLWASYVGTTELCRDLAIDADGDVYVPMGWANSPLQSPTDPAWFATAFANAYQPTRNGKSECGVVKVKSDGSAVLWATWLGGSGSDSMAASIRVDASKNVYVLPQTNSTDAPTTAGAFDRTYNGAADYYLAKLSPDGHQLIYGTYLGGSGDEFLSTHNLAVDANGNAYVSVSTGSPDFPTTAGVFDRTYNGGREWAVVKISPTGALLASTYVGGTGGENPDGIY